MQGRRGAVVLVCGLAAATGAGVWVMRGGEEPALRVETPVAARAGSPAPVTAPVAEAWIAPERSRAEVVPEAAGGGALGGGGDRSGGRDEVMQRFDTDGDGELNEAERAAARAQWEARAAEGRRLLVRRYDRDGDGELNEEERQAARSELRQVRSEIRDRLLPRFDLDGDGELNDQERQAAAPAFRAEYERLRAVAMLDLDGSGEVDVAELARAIIAVGEGSEEMDLNRDGEVDYRDAAYATDVAQGGF